MKKVQWKALFLCFLILFGVVFAKNKVSLSKMKMKQFGSYLKKLLEEGSLTELEQYKISEELDWEENDISLPQFAEYAEYEFNSMKSFGASIHRADLNGDGIANVIEYLNHVGMRDDKNDPLQTSLTIYLGNLDGSYEVAYYKPYFDAYLAYSYTGFSVIQYKGEVYFLFDRPFYVNEEDRAAYAYPYQDKQMNQYNDHEVSRIIAYQYQDKGFSGKLSVFCEYSELIFWDMEGIYGNEAKELAELVGYYWVYPQNEKNFCGEAEQVLVSDSKESIRLKEIGLEKEAEYEKNYQNGEHQASYYSAARNEIYQSDLDNDGEYEIYAKENVALGIYCDGYFRKDKNIFGIYTGNRGLSYIMSKKGEATDFMELCGLELWGTEWIPQMFRVKEQDGRKIVYFQYKDFTHQNGKMEGYYLYNGGYEKVASVKFRPKVSCNVRYEWKEENTKDHNLHYTVYLLKKGEEECGYGYPELYGMEDKELQTEINQKIKNWLGRQIGDVLRKEEEFLPKYIACRSNVCFATQEKLLLRYSLFYSSELWLHTITEYILIYVNLETGEVLIMDFGVGCGSILIAEEYGW